MIFDKLSGVVLRIKNQKNLSDGRVSAQKIFDCLGGNYGGFVFRIAERAGRNRGKRNGSDVVFRRQPQTVGVTIGKHLRVFVFVRAVNRSDRMNDELSRQIAAGRDHGFAGRQAVRILRLANFLAFIQKMLARRVVNRAVNAAAAKQRCVRRIHNRVGFFLRDVAEFDDDATADKVFIHVIL